MTSTSASLQTTWLLARQRNSDQIPARIYEILERQVRHLARLVDDLMDVARITHGKMTVNLHPLRLDELVQRIVSEMALRTDARQQELQVEIDKEVMVMVMGDEVRLTQVIMNLLDNAGKYTPESGRISLEVKREGSEALVRVTDNGEGMGPEWLENLFQPWTQGAQSIERPQGGLGLGFAMARQVVQLHGGSVEAKSEGKDSDLSVLVRLPVMAPNAAQTGNGSSQCQFGTRRWRLQARRCEISRALASSAGSSCSCIALALVRFA